MDLFGAIAAIIVIGYFLMRSVRSDRASSPDKENVIYPAVGKPSLDHRDDVDAEARKRLIGLANEFNVRRQARGLKLLEPEDFADITLARERDVRSKPSTYRYQSPVILLPMSRTKTNIEVDGASWFGGLPSLGDRMWPRSRDGSLMHPVAQIDLTELASIETPEGFPQSGSLSFFVDLSIEPFGGSVVYVPTSDRKPTQPISPLPRLFCPYGRASVGIKGYSRENAPQHFPRWTTSFVPLDVVEDREGDAGVIRDEIQRLFPDSDENYFFVVQQYKDTHPELSIPSKWHTAQRFADLLTNSKAEILQSIRSKRDVVDKRPKDLAKLEQEAKRIAAMRPNPEETPDNFDVRKDRMIKALADKERRWNNVFDQYVADLEFMAANIDNFVDIEAEVVAWAYEHDQWDQMYKNDVVRLDEYLARVKKSIGSETSGLHLFVTGRASKETFANLTLQSMVQAPKAIYDQLPQQVRDDFDCKGRIARRDNYHQMFGLGWTMQGHEDHAEDYLLLKLGRDDAVNFEWGEENAYFWITPDDLKYHRWGNVSVVIGHQ